jgi:hypothetical protein
MEEREKERWGRERDSERKGSIEGDIEGGYRENERKGGIYRIQ